MEAELSGVHPFAPEQDGRPSGLIGLEVRILRVHAQPHLLMEGENDRIDPDKWRPLMMSFCRFYGLGEEVHASRLAEIPETLYRPLRVQQMMMDAERTPLRMA